MAKYQDRPHSPENPHVVRTRIGARNLLQKSVYARLAAPSGARPLVAGALCPDIEQRVFAQEHDAPEYCNWLVAVENYNECYHCKVVHPTFSLRRDRPAELRYPRLLRGRALPSSHGQGTERRAGLVRHLRPGQHLTTGGPKACAIHRCIAAGTRRTAWSTIPCRRSSIWTARRPSQKTQVGEKRTAGLGIAWLSGGAAGRQSRRRHRFRAFRRQAAALAEGGHRCLICTRPCAPSS